MFLSLVEGQLFPIRTILDAPVQKVDFGNPLALTATKKTAQRLEDLGAAHQGSQVRLFEKPRPDHYYGTKLLVSVSHWDLVQSRIPGLIKLLELFQSMHTDLTLVEPRKTIKDDDQRRRVLIPPYSFLMLGLYEFFGTEALTPNLYTDSMDADFPQAGDVSHMIYLNRRYPFDLRTPDLDFQVKQLMNWTLANHMPLALKQQYLGAYTELSRFFHDFQAYPFIADLEDKLARAQSFAAFPLISPPHTVSKLYRYALFECRKSINGLKAEIGRTTDSQKQAKLNRNLERTRRLEQILSRLISAAESYEMSHPVLRNLLENNHKTTLSYRIKKN